MKKRSIVSLVVGGLMAAMLPGAAVAQTEGEVTATFAFNPTCEFGQGSQMQSCEIDESESILTITFSNPQSLSGAFDGIAVLNGSYVGNLADGTFETFGSAFFAGEVEGCGPGTVNFDYAGKGTINADNTNTFESDVYTIVPGGSLAITGGYEQTGTDIDNGDGSATNTYAAIFSCGEG